MRFLPVLLTLTLLVAASAAVAQGEGHDATAYTYRGAIGDIPGTSAREAANAWNVQETLVFDAATTAARAVTLPSGHTFGDLTCTCNGSHEPQPNGRYLFTLDANQTGEHTLTFTHVRPITSPVLLVDIAVPAGEKDDATIVLFVGPGESIEASSGGQQLPAAGRDGMLYVYTGSPESELSGLTAAVAPKPVLPTPDAGVSPLLMLLVGLVAGAIAWAVLVKMGVVQKRSRKQVAAKAVHEEVAKVEAKSTLEARKRVLMAGLKELELAKAGKGIEDADYDALKAEYKRKTVTVMRALESAE